MTFTPESLLDDLAARADQAQVALVRVQPKTGNPVYRTTNSAPLHVGGYTWEPSVDVALAQVEQVAGATDSSSSLVGIFAETLTRAELEAGLLVGAQVEIRLVDGRLPYLGYFDVYRLEVYSQEFDGSSFEIDVSGLGRRLTANDGQIASKLCTLEFGDPFTCGVNLATFSSYAATIQAASTTETLDIAGVAFPAIDNYWAFGYVQVLSGANAGARKGIVASTTGSSIVTLEDRFLLPFAGGELCNVIAGCDRRYPTCQRFNNQGNFGGNKDRPNPNVPIIPANG